jgi:anti-sigma factor RsiW
MGIEDTDLLAYVDGLLPQARRAEIEAAAARVPALAARLSAMRDSALPYAAAFEEQALPPLPPGLVRRVEDLLSVASNRDRHRGPSWLRLGAAFAAGVLCCAIGSQWSRFTATPVATTQVAPWIRAVADYQQMYTRATVASVTEDPGLSARVIDDLRRNDGMAVVVPDLGSLAMTFKRVQRLSFRDRPVVQMVYLPEHGEPIALCVTPDAGPDEAPHPGLLGEMSSVAWRRDHLGYVVLGRSPTQALLALGRLIATGGAGRLYGRNNPPPPLRQAA